jgi:glucose/arabinose dehydrogenase
MQMTSRAAILCLVLLAPRPAAAATLPSGFTESVIATGLNRPTAMTFAPDGRLFVCEQGGALRVITAAGTLLATPFTTVTVDSNGERGLLGVAFDPAFQSNQFVYVYYTATTPTIHNRVSRFTANGNAAMAGSESAVVDLENLTGATNHNGGAIHFGPDGKLYVAVGENANTSNAQSFGNRLGKMLRLNADGSIPTDNPFFNSTSGANRSIFALGLRNPFTFAFQRWTGEMFVNDVGANTWEEINRGIAGANYGWPTVEGVGNNPNFVNPIFAYDHSNGCAISGGAFYSPLTPRFPPAYFGAYFFADHCGGWIRWRSATGTVTNFASGISSNVDLAVSVDGRLYYLARGTSNNTGIVSRVDYTGLSVLVTANGIHELQTITAGNPLTVAIAFSPGSATLNQGEFYVGVAGENGQTLWVDPGTSNLVPTAAPVYSGPAGAFGPTNAFVYPNVSVLAPGRYWWLFVVDADSNGVPNGTVVDFVATRIQ